jgi:DNA polymerase III delta prime subunit
LEKTKWYAQWSKPNQPKPSAKTMISPGPYLLLLGDPGTGKSLLGRALSEKLTQVYKENGIKLFDVVCWKNATLPSEPRISIHKAGEGKKVLRVEQMKELGLLGENVLGTGFSFDLALKMGAGAFVCGEETALIQSIEGKMGEPRQRPPFPVEKGIGGKPTAINNVETWANIPIIFADGADLFAKVGSARSTGTKIFSLLSPPCRIFVKIQIKLDIIDDAPSLDLLSLSQDSWVLRNDDVHVPCHFHVNQFQKSFQ